MLYSIKVYYDIKNKNEYEQFLFNYLIRNYLEGGDLRLTKNINNYNYRYLKLMDEKDEEIEITCKPLSETAIRGYYADAVYIQNSALYKTNSEILNDIPLMFTEEPKIYVFDQTGVIGRWNIK